MLFLAGTLLAAGAATAAETAGQEASVQRGMDARERQGEAQPADCTCRPEADGLRLAPAGTNPEVDRLREQQG
jgi:hypothetical protein